MTGGSGGIEDLEIVFFHVWVVYEEVGGFFSIWAWGKRWVGGLRVSTGSVHDLLFSEIFSLRL